MARVSSRSAGACFEIVARVLKIWAENRRDAYLEALGYATARDRLFQTDLSRRAASGRLARSRRWIRARERRVLVVFQGFRNRFQERRRLAYKRGREQSRERDVKCFGRVHLFDILPKPGVWKQRSRFAGFVGGKGVAGARLVGRTGERHASAHCQTVLSEPE